MIDLPKFDIDFQVTEAAERALIRKMRSKANTIVPSVLWESESSSRPAQWVLGFYNKDKRLELGYLVDCGTIKFVVVQDWVVKSLDGMGLDYVDGNYRFLRPAIPNLDDFEEDFESNQTK